MNTSTLFIRTKTNKYQQTTYQIIERIEVSVNGVNGFESEEIGFEYETLQAAESRLALMNRLRN
jgi:hypothetical protein